jgi:hypothetical protein
MSFCALMVVLKYLLSDGGICAVGDAMNRERRVQNFSRLRAALFSVSLRLPFLPLG